MSKFETITICGQQVIAVTGALNKPKPWSSCIDREHGVDTYYITDALGSLVCEFRRKPGQTALDCQAKLKEICASADSLGDSETN